ncbi:MAG: hypothetical protein ACYDBV_10215 [Nitrospiria bacterium]
MKFFNPFIKAVILMALLIFTLPPIYAQTDKEASRDPNENSEKISKHQNTSHRKPHHKKPHHKKTKKQKPHHSKKKGRHTSSKKSKIKIQADIPLDQSDPSQENREIR